MKCINLVSPVGTRRYNVVATSMSYVALTSQYSCDGNVGRRCKNDVVSTCIKRRHNETLQPHFHCNSMATSERRRIAKSQRRCKVALSNRKQI